MKLKGNWLFVLSVSLLLITQTAHADFRKALDAYQARDGATMLKEVKDAVDKKNDDGLVLFLSNLQLDSAIATSPILLTQNERQEFNNVNSSKKEALLGPPWKIILDDNGVKELFLMLQTASNQSSLESQYRFITLRYGKEYHVIMNQFNQLTKVQINANDKKFYALLDELINKGYAAPLPYLMDEANLKDDLARASALRNKGISLGQTRLLLEQATDYLIGNKKNNTNQNETKGLRLLEQALAKPDDEFYYANIASKVSGYYLKKGDMQSLHQAYLWSLVALTTSRSGLVPSSLIELKKTGVLKKVAPNIDSLWDASFNSTMQRMTELGMDITQFYNSNNLPKELKEIRDFEQPELISKTRKIDLEKQPVLSFHHFYYDAFYVRDLASVRNYLIDIYADGRVNFALGNAFDRHQNSETYTRISTKEVQQLITKVRNVDFDNMPLSNDSKNAYFICTTADCSDMYPNRVDTLHSFYYVTLRDKNKRTVMFHNREGDDPQLYLAKVFKLLKERINTQQYSCGNMKNRQYYQHCTSQDTKFFEIAKKGEAK